MFPSKFEYRRVASVDEAVSILSQEEDAKILAGGHSLIPLMKLRLASPELLVDITKIENMSYIREDDGEIAIGALTRHHALETSELLAREVPVLPAVAATVGDPAVRHCGTLGGTASHGDGASDLPAALLALDATFVAKGPKGERRIAAKDFFTGFLETALAPFEVLTEIRVPKGYRSYSFQKFNRRAQDWAIVGVVAVRNGTTNIGYVNMGVTPLRATAVEQQLASGASDDDAAAAAAAGLTPPSDINGSSEYRAHLAGVLVRRALSELG